MAITVTILRKAFWPWERRLHISVEKFLATLCGKTCGWWGTYEVNNETPTCGKCIGIKKQRDREVRKYMDEQYPHWGPEDCCGNKDTCCGGAFDGNGTN